MTLCEIEIKGRKYWFDAVDAPYFDIGGKDSRLLFVRDRFQSDVFVGAAGIVYPDSLVLGRNVQEHKCESAKPYVYKLSKLRSELINAGVAIDATLFPFTYHHQSVAEDLAPYFNQGEVRLGAIQNIMVDLACMKGDTYFNDAIGAGALVCLKKHCQHTLDVAVNRSSVVAEYVKHVAEFNWDYHVSVIRTMLQKRR